MMSKRTEDAVDIIHCKFMINTWAQFSATPGASQTFFLLPINSLKYDAVVSVE